MMDRNLVVAIVLSVLIIVGFQYFFQSFSKPVPKKPPEATQQTKPGEAPPVSQPEKPASQAVQEREPSLEPVPKPVVTTPPPAARKAEEVLVKIDGPMYEALVSPVGARIVSFKLKDYKTSLASGELKNLFPQDRPDTSGPSIIFTRRDERFSDADLPYESDTRDTSIKLEEKGPKKAITFSTTTGGLTISKTFTFSPDSYLVGFTFSVTNNSDETRNYLLTFPWRKAIPAEPDNRFTWNSAEILLNGEIKDYYFTNIKGEEEPSGKVQWAGLGSAYFFKALVFGSTPATKVTLFKPSADGVAEIMVRYEGMDLKPKEKVDTNLAIYLGPKEREALHTAGHQLDRALFYSNYKILDIMSEYLMVFLRFCDTGFTVFGIKIPGTHNYGIDIIFLTVLIKILFIPLTHKSMKSMKRMQELQPQLAKLKEKLKDDKAALNKATMDLFRDQKVNPLSGCWPMFLQLPVFVALYQALSYAIELRHAQFVCFPSIYLCINDLSAPDPYYVTPVLMGGTMVLQQWMTPSAGDPMQKKMMLLMPVVFTYMFLSFPSGLVLYWLVSNLLSIGQQIITNKMAN